MRGDVHERELANRVDHHLGGEGFFPGNGKKQDIMIQKDSPRKHPAELELLLCPTGGLSRRDIYILAGMPWAPCSLACWGFSISGGGILRGYGGSIEAVELE